jgi:hypothetical protein
VWELVFDRYSVGTASHDHDPFFPGEWRKPIPRVAQERLPRTRKVMQKLGGIGP